MPNKIKHNLNESYLQSLTEEERVRQMSEWTIEEQIQYFCPNGTMSIDEFQEFGHQIIIDEYENSDLHYWAEVSGAIEYYFKKHNGYPMPNTLASEILNISESEIKPLTDFVHYERPIGENREIFTKMIFGIKSEDIFQKAIKEVENYASFMREVNNITESTGHYTIKQTLFIIENIYRAHEEDGFNELIPSWHKALIDSLNVLNNTPNKNQTIYDYIQYGEYLLDDMQILKLHKLNGY